VKTLPGALATHQALGTTTLAWGLKVVRPDAVVYGFTSASADVTISSVLYKSAPGLDVTGLSLSAGMNVDNLELTTLDDGTVFTKSDVLAGVWKNSAFVLFRYNWASPTDGVDVMLAGNLGDVELRRNTVWCELHGLQRILQESVGNVSTKNCRARLGDALCTKDLTTFTKTGTLTTVTSAQVFRDSARTEAVDYFTEGTITFNAGIYAGLPLKVKAYASNGTFTLALPMIAPPLVGYTYTAVAGCQKRLAEDCATKFSNVLNFQGEPHRPLMDDLTKVAEAAV
jgi:uncharacterized phage protein (TIGR02218 family)